MCNPVIPLRTFTPYHTTPTMLQPLRIKLKQELDILRGRKSRISRQVNCTHAWYGNQYGGFYAHPEVLNAASVVYSFGIGEDISFDRAIIERHGCQVFGFDPTPKSIDWVGRQQLPEGFHFYPYGIGVTTGFVQFNLPKNKEHVSGSMVQHRYLDEQNSISVPMKSFADILSELGHQRIDVLKMDIEGAEYGVLQSVLDTPVEIRQILIEVHERFFDDGRAKTRQLLQALAAKGFEVFAVSDSLEEISLIHRSISGQ